MKERNKLLKYLNDVLKIGLGFERLFFFIIIFLILAHVTTCIMFISAQFGGEVDDNGLITDYSGTWMENL